VECSGENRKPSCRYCGSQEYDFVEVRGVELGKSLRGIGAVQRASAVLDPCSGRPCLSIETSSTSLSSQAQP